MDQDFTKSGISSADHPDMSDSGKIQAKKSDGPMIEAQLDRLRSVDINIDSGKTQAAWGDASDDLMSLCKVYNVRKKLKSVDLSVLINLHYTRL